MYSLLQSRRARGDAGEPIPSAFKSLEAQGTKFVRGQLSLVAAGGGTGKSAFMLTQALKSEVPTLYFSADSDAYIQLSRSIAILYVKSMDEACKWARSGMIPDTAVEALNDPMIRFNYNASPSLDDLENSVDCYDEVYGEYPALIVVDNITNVRGTGDGNDSDPFKGLESLMDYLNTMARETGAHVSGLHHVTGPFNDADKPIPMSGVKGQISRVPAMILTLFKQEEEFGDALLCVSTVKNRGGKSDPSGQKYVELIFNDEMLAIKDRDPSHATFT
ncbi:AAA family ATPase [Streptomyces albulus]|nr:AAA family ATPase [Streptomyces noursei]